MKAVIQRVIEASVETDSKVVAKIGRGLLVYVGIASDDEIRDAEFIAKKICELRIFEDENGKMNRSVTEVDGSVLIISNFTLVGSCRKGRRPSFDNAAEPVFAEQLYEQLVDMVKSYNLNAEKGVFQAHMHVESVNDGPVTFIVESPSGKKNL
jgi:D-tyrosyl-tRNA(Tyr) deacylase